MLCCGLRLPEREREGTGGGSIVTDDRNIWLMAYREHGERFSLFLQLIRQLQINLKYAPHETVEHFSFHGPKRSPERLSSFKISFSIPKIAQSFSLL